MKSLIIFVVIIFGMASVPVQTLANENLYVSLDVMIQNLPNKFEPTIESLDGGGCSSQYPENYKHISYFRYIDRISPTLNAGFYKNEFPLIIDSTKFSITQFSSSDFVTIDINKPTEIKLLLFENTGPHKIQNVTVFTSFSDNDFPNDTFIQITKDPFPREDTPFYNYLPNIGGDIILANKYPNKLGNYTTNVSDPQNIFSDVTVTAAKVNHKMEIILEVNFTQPIGKSNLGIIASDFDNNTIFCNVIDAIDVVDKN
jgi:hypothetical protein